MTYQEKPVCYATGKDGTAYASQDPNEAGALALTDSHSSCREVLVTVERYTDIGNPYVVPFGWFTRSMLKTWREQEKHER